MRVWQYIVWARWSGLLLFNGTVKTLTRPACGHSLCPLICIFTAIINIFYFTIYMYLAIHCPTLLASLYIVVFALIIHIYATHIFSRFFTVSAHSRPLQKAIRSYGRPWIRELHTSGKFMYTILTIYSYKCSYVRTMPIITGWRSPLHIS